MFVGVLQLQQQPVLSANLLDELHCAGAISSKK
jgi:hypothetical protein